MNFLEQLAAEWYAYRGYFVRTNVKFGRRRAGGYEGEMDVVAFHPREKVLVHAEPSMDADSWRQREQKFRRKFRDAEEHYGELFQFHYERVDRVAVCGWGRSLPQDVSFGDIVIKTLPSFVSEIMKELKRHDPYKDIVPEHWPLLRALQMGLHWGTVPVGETRPNALADD